MSTITQNSKIRDRQAANRAALCDIIDKLTTTCYEAICRDDAISVTIKIPIRYGKLCDPTLAIERR